jgi:hypothetical protein
MRERNPSYSIGVLNFRVLHRIMLNSPLIKEKETGRNAPWADVELLKIS